MTRVMKRIIVCCDGTWVDGTIVDDRWKYTNILRLARTIKHEDDRHDPAIPQIVFYQAGIGSEDGFRSKVIDGTTGANLADKVQEAYAFIAHNYQPGDEIFVFGFSRGAYTARMIAMMIGQIGVLDRTEMDHFADVFVAFQKRGKTSDPQEIAKLDAQLKPWVSPDAHGRRRAQYDDHTFSVKCVGVFDTVGSLGLPDEISFASDKMRTIFGFNDHSLGVHVERAYHAMALNELRKDFTVCKYEQTEAGRRKGQVLKQHWFTGVHADIGGGYQQHDLADLTLTWMVANVENILAMDMQYLASFPDPVAPYGKETPHNSLTGVYVIAEQQQRTLPTATDNITHEMIHPSAMMQSPVKPAELQKLVAANAAIVAQLMPLEQVLKDDWPYDPNSAAARAEQAPTAKKDPVVAATESSHHRLTEALYTGLALAEKTLDHVGKTKAMQTENGAAVYEPSWLGRRARESPMGTVLKEFGH